MPEEMETPDEYGLEESILNWINEIGWETYGLKGGEGASILDQKHDREHTEAIYWNILKDKVLEINDELSESEVEGFIHDLKLELNHDNLMEANKQFHEILRKGKLHPVNKKRDPESDEEITVNKYIKLIDFDNIENNSFIAANQFRFLESRSIRPDITLFVNGIPLVNMELKSLAQDNDYHDAISDLQDYEENASRLFVPSLFNVAADTTEYRYGTLGVSHEHYYGWNEAPEEYQNEDNKMKQAVQAMLNPTTLLDILDNYVFYERKVGGTVKIVPRYMQYYACKEIFDRIENDEYKRGLLWHTQGSGKSYTMVYAAKQLLSGTALNSPQVLILVDTDKLRTQMQNLVSNIGFEQFETANTGEHLQEMLENGSSQLIISTMQMFKDVDKDVQGNENTVVFADEAHRFMEKDLGTYLDAAVPDAYHFGFTGTPVEESGKRGRDTFMNYSPGDELYLHRYSMKDGIEDNLILPVYFTLRHDMKWEINEEEMDEEYEKALEDMSPEEKQEVLEQQLGKKDIAELRNRVEIIVQEIIDHFKGVEENEWKGMVVTPSRKAAAIYGDELRKFKNPEEIEVLITSEGDDEKLIQKYHTTRDKRDRIVKEFKEEENPKILVVCDMLLTGFDAPVLKTMYLDRYLSGHNLLQAMARTNRVAEGKNNGEIVDFQGAYQELEDAFEYEPDVHNYAFRTREDLFEKFDNLMESLLDIFEGIPKDNSQETVSQCLSRLSKEPNTRMFKQGFRRLQDFYESISPDKKLAQNNRLDNYKWLNYIYISFRRSRNRDENPEEDLREKTKKIIEDNVEIEKIKRDYPVYEVSKEHLEMVKDLEPAAQAAEVAHATQDHLQPRVESNPRYKKLSERVNEILNSWQSGSISDPDAVDELRAVEEEVIEIKEEQKESEMNEAEYAIYTAITDDYEEYIEGEEKAKEFAKTITENFEENIDTSFENWKANPDIKNDIEKMLIRVIYKDIGKKELIHDENFIERTINYLVENYE